jgi:hypothetical protein
MGVFSNRTSMDRILFAVFNRENQNQGVSTPLLLTQNFFVTRTESATRIPEMAPTRVATDKLCEGARRLRRQKATLVRPNGCPPITRADYCLIFSQVVFLGEVIAAQIASHQSGNCAVLLADRWLSEPHRDWCFTGACPGFPILCNAQETICRR